LHHAALLATHHAEGVFIQVEPHVHKNSARGPSLSSDEGIAILSSRHK
jgi:hypothetical protein